MQSPALHLGQNAVVMDVLSYDPKLYADQPGADHPTPPAPDRGKSGSKPKPKPAPKTNKKKK